MKAYDLENQGKDETTILAVLNNPESALNMAVAPPRDFFLLDARYSYPGKNPTRPQDVSFTFISDEGKNKYKGAVDFSVSAEGIEVHQGEVSLGQRSFHLNGQKITQQVLTVAMPTDVFLRITQAKKVQFKVGPKSYKLNDYQRKVIVALAGTMGPASK